LRPPHRARLKPKVLNLEHYRTRLVHSPLHRRRLDPWLASRDGMRLDHSAFSLCISDRPEGSAANRASPRLSEKLINKAPKRALVVDLLLCRKLGSSR
jgi:hypothetical protein